MTNTCKSWKAPKLIVHLSKLPSKLCFSKLWSFFKKKLFTVMHFSGLCFCPTIDITREHCPLVSQTVALCFWVFPTHTFSLTPIFPSPYSPHWQLELWLTDRSQQKVWKEYLSMSMGKFVHSCNNTHGYENNLFTLLYRKLKLDPFRLGDTVKS